MKLKNIIWVLLVVLISMITTIGVNKFLFKNNIDQATYEKEQLPARYTNLPVYTSNNQKSLVDFTIPAAKTTPAVVHVKTIVSSGSSIGNDQYNDLFGDELFKWFYGNRGQAPRESQASGSGVIISKDGYIVTNNHVVENAKEIEVALSNNKSYKAELIGKDKDTDIALIKIQEDNLPIINFVNSDSVQVGEWVLAVGNPFNLASTVTAGIVSAKGRNINILQNRTGDGGNTAIESFIQTDAAVNPGNSGGALVNVDGNLIGINTAIATPTGTFAGYSFAVPSNLVKKVVKDLKDFGVVQRGFLGVNIRSVDNKLAEELKLKKVQGVYLENVIEGSAAEEGGLKKGDIITKISGDWVNSSPELQEKVATHRPGDKIEVEYIRDGLRLNTSLVLKNKYNNVSLINESNYLTDVLGAELVSVSESEKERLGLRGGLKVVNLKNGKLKEFTDIKEGFIIILANDQPVNSVSEFANILSNVKGNVMLEGIYPEKANATFLYAFKY